MRVELFQLLCWNPQFVMITGPNTMNFKLCAIGIINLKLCYIALMVIIVFYIPFRGDFHGVPFV